MNIKIMVALADGTTEERAATFKALIEAGMVEGNYLSTIGVVTGEAPEDKFEALRAISGVMSVEKQRLNRTC